MPDINNSLLQLYPLPAGELPLDGAYLAHELRQQAENHPTPYIYANFITSLDGRIAIPHPDGQGLVVPKAIANSRDWRLFQELAAQADLIFTSGRYLRDWAAGRAQEILQVDDPQFADLRDWRVRHGLPTHPDLAIISASLDFPIPDVLTAEGRRVVVLTTANPDLERVRELEAKAGQVVVAGEERVDGSLAAKCLAELGYRVIYSAAGPQILHTLATGGNLNRLYLTHANRLLGGQPFASVLEGKLLHPSVEMKLRFLYLDSYALDGLGQLFISYDLA